MPEIPIGQTGRPEIPDLGWRGLILIFPGWLEIPSLLVAGLVKTAALRAIVRSAVGWLTLAVILVLSKKILRGWRRCLI